MFSLLSVDPGHHFVWHIWVTGLLLGSRARSSVLEVGEVLLRLGTPLHLILRKSLSRIVDSDFNIFVADVIWSFDTVDRGVFDCVLSRPVSACILSTTLTHNNTQQHATTHNTPHTTHNTQHTTHNTQHTTTTTMQSGEAPFEQARSLHATLGS